jgi:uncharacterized protein (TIGR02302 family)
MGAAGLNANDDRTAKTTKRLGQLVSLARAAYLWEALWRALIPPLVVAGLFLCVSWLGLWLELPHSGRLIGTGLFAILFLGSLFGLRHLRLLSRTEALSRIDRASGLGHRPASVLDDRLANEGHDPATAALWALHRKRAEAQIDGLRAGLASPRAVEFDRYALRAGILVALVASAFIAGPERYARTAAAFDWNLKGADGPGYRIDAWIDPPAYTGKAPVLLDLASAAARDEGHPAEVEAPAGSTVIVRSSGGQSEVETSGLLAPPPPPKEADKQEIAKAAALAEGDTAQKFILRGDARLILRHAGGLKGIFKLKAIPDKPPAIMLREIPKSNARGTLSLAYTVSDDYGVSKAEAVFENPKIGGVPAAGPSLADPPLAALSVPSTLNGLGDGETTIDLSEHPWAGTRVTMTLVAHDEGGNEGRSDPVEITLPQKPFLNPVARALVEQRRNLVLDPNHSGKVKAALDALMIEPGAFQTPAAVYLGLRFASDSLAGVKSKAELIATADFLWSMALQIENGDLTDAERALRAAEKELREAIERKAPEEEIKKLTENLQAAMDKFLNELAQQQQREEQKDANAQQSGTSKTISRKDLQALIDKLRQASRSGNKEEAKKALEELQDLLENLKTAKHQKPDPKARAMAQALNELDQMTRDQQELRDETYKDSQSAAEPPRPNGRPGPRPQKGPGANRQQPGEEDEGEQAEGPQGNSRQGKPPAGQPGDLQKRQQELSDRLEAVQKRLKQAGQGQEALDEAGKSMRDAEDALGQGQDGQGEAVDKQGKALDNLRKGAKKLADAMQQGDGDQNGQDQSDQEGQSTQGGEGQQGSQEGQQTGDADPLGRPRGGNPFSSNSKFDPLGIPAAQRAQRVLEELRRRLADPSRSQEETDYLERLLRPY